jgi:CTP synthase (UTP-ammonia lyase)
MRIGLIGDKSDAVRAHAAIPRALELVRSPVTLVWLPTDRLSHASDADLQPHDAFWCVPGSPYASLDGPLRAIRFARETLNPQYRSLLESGPLRISAHDDAGEVRAVELAGHPFFVATLFQPELSALSGTPHPLTRAFARAAERA